MGTLIQRSKIGINVDSFRAWPWLILLMLSGITWILPLSPAVTTLESHPRPPFSGHVTETTDNSNLSISERDKIFEKSGCNKKGYGDLGDHCKPLGKALGKMGAYFIDGEEEEQGKVPWDRDPDILPQLQAKCWCPAQFDESQVTYAQHTCANLLNRLVRGLGNESQSAASRPDKALEEIIETVTQRPVYIERKDVFDRYNTLISHKISFLLFLFALALLFPSLLWWKISSSAWCGLNVDKTLEMLQQTQGFDPDSRKKTYQEIAQETVAESLSSGKTTKLFLLCKILTLGVPLTLLFANYQLVQQPISKLAVELKELSDMAKLIPFQNHFLFQCSFFIENLRGREEFLLQCSTLVPYLDGVSTSRQANPHLQLDDARRIVLIYRSLFHAISAFLILHATFNLCGLLEWTWRLYVHTSCRFPCRNQSHYRSTRYVEDVRFLLYNVHEQLGHVVSRELADSFSQFERENNSSLFEAGKSETDLQDLS